MKTKTTHALSMFPPLLSLALLCGCFSGKGAQQKALAQKRTFIPLVEAPAPATQAPLFGALKIRPFKVLPPYDARNFVVRREGGETVLDFYNGWLASPAELIRVQATRYLEASGLFASVYDAGSGTSAPIGLEGLVGEFYLDYAGTSPAAVVKLRFLLLDERTPLFNVLFTSEKESRAPIIASEKNAASQAFSRALARALEALVKDLARAPLPPAAPRP